MKKFLATLLFATIVTACADNSSTMPTPEPGTHVILCTLTAETHITDAACWTLTCEGLPPKAICEW